MKRLMSIVVPVIAAFGLVVLFAFLVSGKQIDVLNPAGYVASQQRQILMFAVFLSALVVIPVFALLTYFSVRYRASSKTARYDPEWGENRWLEGLWWGVPIVIIGILGVLTYQTSHSLDPYKEISGGRPLDVQVVALRWKWLFLYPQQGVATLNHMPVPLDRPVKLSMTANAPMSALWIPAIGSQTYAMNGMSSRLNLKGTKIGEYTGYTTNINGEGYSKMTFKTRVMETGKFDTWVSRAKKSHNAMTTDAYHALSTPKSETDERTYKLTDVALFDDIIGMNANHAHHTEGM